MSKTYLPPCCFTNTFIDAAHIVCGAGSVPGVHPSVHPSA